MFDVWKYHDKFSQAVTIGYPSGRIRPISMSMHAECQKSGRMAQIRKMSTMRK